MYRPRRECVQEGHVQRGREQVGLATNGCVARSTRQEATAERRPRNGSYAEHLTKDSTSALVSSVGERRTDLECGEHFALLFTVEQAVVVLHRDEGR